ncbi:DUF2164 family protein [Litoribacterium kuwaitense]|uniref:DUF2164 family protein n=1 Tax=Litoribacterium kuwaitense TaxID=1398745 RepID=UPI001FE97097|nr:DUF2164 family protein [Litoribacterium kuwaitense]
MLMPITIPKREKLLLLEQFRQEVEKELGEDPGPFVGEHLMDFILKQAGPYVYNMAIQDARMMLEEKYDSMVEELYSLEKRHPKL